MEGVKRSSHRVCSEVIWISCPLRAVRYDFKVWIRLTA